MIFRLGLVFFSALARLVIPLVEFQFERQISYLVFSSQDACPRTFITCFDLELSVFKSKKVENCPRTLPRMKKLDTKPLLEYL